ncbi:hypothetical protein ACP70R_015698 [Stipagrostis hirtigluma subsp. patula]
MGVEDARRVASAAGGGARSSRWQASASPTSAWAPRLPLEGSAAASTRRTCSWWGCPCPRTPSGRWPSGCRRRSQV